MTAHTVIHTDGACAGNPGPGGFAAIIEQDGKRTATVSGGDPQTTNNRMELSAVIEGLRLVNSTTPAGAAVTVRSDSTYVIRAFNNSWLENWQRNGWRNSKRQPVPNRDLWETLLEQVRNREITWKWVKGHSGDPQNEECDRLAVEQSLKADREPGYYIVPGSPIQPPGIAPACPSAPESPADLTERLDRELERAAALLREGDHPALTAIIQAQRLVQAIRDGG